MKDLIEFALLNVRRLGCKVESVPLFVEIDVFP
jgi:hypothetical protein